MCIATYMDKPALNALQIAFAVIDDRDHAERTFGARQLVGCAWIDLERLTQHASRCLEGCLDEVMCVLALEGNEVERDARRSLRMR